LEDVIPPDDLCRFVPQVVEHLDLKAFVRNRNPRGDGAPQYDPAILLAIWFYALARGVRSSRAVEAQCRENFKYMYVARRTTPDHGTLCRFRVEHREAFEAAFEEWLTILHRARMLSSEVVALDGTKIAANAALEANRTLPELKKEIRRTVKRISGEIDRAEEEVPEEIRITPEMMRECPRLTRLVEAKRRLDEEKKKVLEEQNRKIEGHREEHKRGNPPKSLEETAKEFDEERKINVTDPESRPLKGRGGVIQGCNVQAVVNRDQIILSVAIADAGNDIRQLVPMTERLLATEENLGIPAPKVILADAGYHTPRGILTLQDKGIECLIPPDRQALVRQYGEMSPTDPRLTDTASLMREALRSEEKRKLYDLRKIMIEPVFGQIKESMGFRRFLLRGNPKQGMEILQVCLVHNIMKIYRKLKGLCGRTMEEVLFSKASPAV
jgi:transposase